MKIVLGDICYPKAEALIIPANTKGTMRIGRQSKISKAGLSSVAKEAKWFTMNNDMKPGGCFSTGPGRLNRRGLKKIYHAIIKRLQSDFTSIYIVRDALYNALSSAVNDGMQTVTVCGLGIDEGELDKKTVALITLEQINKFSSKIEIKIVDDNEEFINELNNLRKE